MVNHHYESPTTCAVRSTDEPSRCGLRDFAATPTDREVVGQLANHAHWAIGCLWRGEGPLNQGSMHRIVNQRVGSLQSCNADDMPGGIDFNLGDSYTTVPLSKGSFGK